MHTTGTKRRFVHRINRRATALGLADTHYSNPSGIIDVGNHLSAWDVASLSRTVLRQKVLRHLVRRASYRARNGAVYPNRNPLVSLPGRDRDQERVAPAGLPRGGRPAAHRTLIAVLLHARGARCRRRHAARLGLRHRSS